MAQINPDRPGCPDSRPDRGPQMNALHRLDPVYFARRPWKERIQEWLQHQQDDDKENPFLQGNLEAIRRIMKDASTGLRMVVNISAKALLTYMSDR
jgi:hypothetical protein